MTISEQVDQLLTRRIGRAKGSPNYCTYYAKRTPSIPYHNGWTRPGDKCTGCRKVKP